MHILTLLEDLLEVVRRVPQIHVVIRPPAIHLVHRFGAHGKHGHVLAQLLPMLVQRTHIPQICIVARSTQVEYADEIAEHEPLLPIVTWMSVNAHLVPRVCVIEVSAVCVSPLEWQL